MKENIRKEYNRRIRMVLKSKLNSANKLEAINTLAVPVGTYSFNINWTLQELARLDTKTRKFLTMYKKHHPKSDEDRLYLPRTEGGRGLIQLELSYKSTTIGLDKYLRSRRTPSSNLSKTMTSGNPWLHQQTVNEVQSETGSAYNTTCGDEADTTAKAKHKSRKQLRSKWESKAPHGKYPQRVKQAEVDQDKTHRWLKAAGLKAETEGFIITAQGQSLPIHTFPIRWYQHNILKNPDVDPKWRLCGRFDETINHLVSVCPELGK